MLINIILALSFIISICIFLVEDAMRQIAKQFQIHQEGKYFTLNKPKTSLTQNLLTLVTGIVFLPLWIISFIVARIVTNLALDPDNIKRQKLIHLVKMNDKSPTDSDNTEALKDDLVVVNFAKHDKHKKFTDYLVKAMSIMGLPALDSVLKNKLTINDKEHIDTILDEINLLLVGDSSVPECKGRTFKWEQIHLKGIEFLDAPLKAYFDTELQKRFGEQATETQRTVSLDFYSLQTTDDAVLDSVMVQTPEEETKPWAERKFVILPLPHKQNYISWIKDMNYTSKHIGCSTIGFNYRGADYSKGKTWTNDNMVHDVIAQVQYLLARGAKPENIGIEGQCLGGAVATIAAAKLHEDGYKVKLYNERSFRSLPRFLLGYILPTEKDSRSNPVTWLKYAAAGLTYAIFTPILWIAGWHVDAASAWDRVPFDDKNYSVVRTNLNAKCQRSDEADGVIHDTYASIASKIDEQRTELNERQKKGQRPLTLEEQKVLEDPPESHYFKPSKGAASDAEVQRIYGKEPHFLPRRKLVMTEKSREDTTCHDHMVESLRASLGRI